MDIEAIIRRTAARYGLDENLAVAVARAESAGREFTIEDQGRISRAGAIGLFQLMPATAAELGVNPRDLLENIDGGVRYLVKMLRGQGGDIAKALAAYNWGPGNMAKAVASWGTEWASHLPAETLQYIPRVFRYMGGAWSPGSAAPGSGTSNAMLILAMALLGGALILSLSE